MHKCDTCTGEALQLVDCMAQTAGGIAEHPPAVAIVQKRDWALGSKGFKHPRNESPQGTWFSDSVLPGNDKDKTVNTDNITDNLAATTTPNT